MKFYNLKFEVDFPERLNGMSKNSGYYFTETIKNRNMILYITRLQTIIFKIENGMFLTQEENRLFKKCCQNPLLRYFRGLDKDNWEGLFFK